MSCKRTVFRLSLILFMAGICHGCGKPAAPVNITRDEAQKKFVKILEETYNYPAVVRQVENTLWVYLPIKDPIILIKASKDGVKISNQSTNKPSLKFIDTRFDGTNFLTEYDIETSKTYVISYGYSTGYDEKFARMQTNVYDALQNAYFDVGFVPGDIQMADPKEEKPPVDLVHPIVKTDHPPEFVVLVITDIVNGIEIINTFYFNDFKLYKSPTQALSQVEYYNRNLSRVEGNQNAINDMSGQHLPFTPVKMGDFIAQQIRHRVNFKYTNSSFPPGEDAAKEIQASAAQAISAYQFSAFESLRITDLNGNTETSFTKDQILSLPEAKEKSEGKIHVINFLSPQKKD